MTYHSDAYVQPLLSGKAVSITYCEFVFVALGILHAIRMRHIVICGLSGCTLFLHIKGAISGKKTVQHKIYFDFLYNFRPKHFSFYE
jgi:hypothetical protein